MLCVSQDHPFGADAVFLWTRVRSLVVPQLLMATVLTADGLEKNMREPQQAQETVSKQYKEHAFCKAWTAALSKSVSAHGRGLFPSRPPGNTREKRLLLAGNTF